jgi:hypothetical protein
LTQVGQDNNIAYTDFFDVPYQAAIDHCSVAEEQEWDTATQLIQNYYSKHHYYLLAGNNAKQAAVNAQKAQLCLGQRSLATQFSQSLTIDDGCPSIRVAGRSRGHHSVQSNRAQMVRPFRSPSMPRPPARACCCLTPTRPEGGRGATRD